MKWCGWCKQSFSVNAFAFRSLLKGTRQPYCKNCISDYCRAHYVANKPEHNRRRVRNWQRYRHRNRKLLQEFLSSKVCIDCGQADPIVLEFDHVTGEKLGNICEMVGAGAAWARIEEEVAKCEIRCVNCHRRKTATQFQWSNKQIGA